MARSATYAPDELRNVARHLKRIAEVVEEQAAQCDGLNLESIEVSGEGEKHRFMGTTQTWAHNVELAVREARELRGDYGPEAKRQAEAAVAKRRKEEQAENKSNGTAPRKKQKKKSTKR